MSLFLSVLGSTVATRAIPISALCSWIGHKCKETRVVNFRYAQTTLKLAAICVRNHRSMLKMARWQNPLLCCHTWSHQKLQFRLCSSQRQTLQNKGQMTQDLPYWTIRLAECWTSMRTLWMSEWSVFSTQDVFPASHRHRHTADVALPESIKAWGIQW